MKPVPVRKLQFDLLSGGVFETNEVMGLAAALDAREIIQQTISSKGCVNLILATGNSQLTFLHSLRDLDGIAWSKVNVFHMDDYIHLDPNHRASFPLFLRKHLLDAVKPGNFFLVPGYMEDVDQACQEYEALLREHPADLVALGIGENCHLAFNDPPTARFFDSKWVKIVQLSEASRRQQWKEGHFDTLEEVPTQAITLTIPALLQSTRILCIVPEARKADSVRAVLCDPVDEDRPGSILRVVKNAVIYLDIESAEKI